MQSKGCTKDSAPIRFIFDRRTKPQGSIKEDWCSYAIGQDLPGRSRLHTIFATENDGDFKKAVPKKGVDKQFGVQYAKKLIRPPAWGDDTFRQEAAKKDKTRAVHRTPWFEAVTNEIPPNQKHYATETYIKKRIQKGRVPSLNVRYVRYQAEIWGKEAKGKMAEACLIRKAADRFVRMAVFL